MKLDKNKENTRQKIIFMKRKNKKIEELPRFQDEGKITEEQHKEKLFEIL